MSVVSQPWPGLAAAMMLCTGCDDLFNIERVTLAPADATDAPPQPTDIVQLAAGGANSCVVRGSGEVLCWGRASGALASNDAVIPRLVIGDAVHIAVGDAGVCATLADHTAKCWGENGNGELGVGTTGPITAMPVVDGALQVVTDIAAYAIGNDVGCALHVNGAITCAGRGGLRGEGTVDASSTHGASVALITDAVALAAGDRHVCALRVNGEIWCWGENYRHQLGSDATVDGTQPLKVPGGPWIAVTAGDEFTCAIQKVDNALFCWGANENWQTADGTTADHGTPALVAGQGTGVVGTAGGAYSGYLVRADGSLAAWGLNQLGQLGIGNTISQPLAATLALGNAVEVSSGTGLHACARTADHHVYCWGDNAYGQLGSGNKNALASPAEVTLP